MYKRNLIQILLIARIVIIVTLFILSGCRNKDKLLYSQFFMNKFCSILILDNSSYLSAHMFPTIIILQHKKIVIPHLGYDPFQVVIPYLDYDPFQIIIPYLDCDPSQLVIPRLDRGIQKKVENNVKFQLTRMFHEVSQHLQPEVCEIPGLSEDRLKFIKKVSSTALEVNSNILKIRNKLLLLIGVHQQKTNKLSLLKIFYPIEENFSELNVQRLMQKNQYTTNYKLPYKKVFTVKEKQWLKNLAKKYKLKNINFSKRKTWKDLLNHVDVVPVSIVVAQAICESNWGKSRFANEGYNYFGLHCNKKGCGMIPIDRNSNDYFEVARFQSIKESIEHYEYNINTCTAYRNFRKLREDLHIFGYPLDGEKLVIGLQNYSKQGNYVKSISELIRDYRLWRYDR